MKGKKLRISKIHKRNEKFNLSGNVDTSGVTLDPNLTPLYSDRVIEYAKILKAKNGDGKYSDEYYLNYAKGIDIREMQGAYTEIFNKKAALCPIQDPQWAGYSYEEILQMEQSGYKIPEEVLLWAHAQQESDITAYEIISDDIDSDDNSSTEEVTGDSDINNLQKKAKEYILKSEKAQKNAQQKIEEYQVITEKANEIKREKENSYKDSMKEIINLTNDWKELDKKKKNNTITTSEQNKYNELSKQLGSNGSASKEFQVENDDLDKLLATMNLLSTDATEDITLAQDTIKAGVDLAELNRNYNSNQATHSTSGIIFSNMGNLDDILFGASGSSTQRIAIDTGRDLEALSNDTLTNLNSGETTDLKQFATEYTTEFDKTEQYKKDTMGTAYSANSEQQTPLLVSEQKTEAKNNSGKKSAQKTTITSLKENTNKSIKNNETNQDEPKDEYGENKNFFVLPVGGRPALAIAATVTSAISTSNLKNKQSEVNETEKTAKSNLKKSQTDIKNLNQETKKLEARHEANVQKAKEYSEQLANLDAMTLQALQSAQKQKQPAQNTKAQGADTDEGVQETQQTPQAYPYQAETEAVVQQISSLSAQDAKDVASIKIPVAQTEASLLKSHKSNALLYTQNQKLTERKQNNKTVSINTLICGNMTIGVGAINLAQSIPLISCPFTHPIGVALAAYASVQLATGAGATAAGTTGLVVCGNASDDIKEHQNNYDEILKINSETKKYIWAANKSIAQLKSIAVPETAEGMVQKNSDSQNNNSKDSNNFPDLDNKATSRTGTMTFADIKDISKIPTGPTNLSNPLNKANTTQANTEVEKDSANKNNSTQNTPVTEKIPNQNQEKTTSNTVNINKPSGINNDNTNTNQMANNKNGSAKVDNILQADMDKIQRGQRQAATLNTRYETADNANNNNISEPNESETVTAETKSTVPAFNNNLNLISQNKQTNDTEEVINTQTNNVDDMLNENTKTSQILEDKIIALNSSSQNTDEKEDTTGDIARLQRKLDDNDIDTAINNQETSNDNIPMTEEEDSNNNTDTAMLAAAATTSANLNNNITTDDKATRKLERFNNDSIIESKKKRKKVMAVSAASGGSVKG